MLHYGRKRSRIKVMQKDEIVTKTYVSEAIEHAVGIMLEKMDDNNRLIMEVLIPMKEKVDRIPAIEATIAEMQRENAVFKASLKATNKDVAGHERRITHLEAKTA